MLKDIIFDFRNTVTNNLNLLAMYLFFDQPLILLALIALPFLWIMGINWEANRKPKTISRKKTKQLVRKAVKANEIPQQFRRYNF